MFCGVLKEEVGMGIERGGDRKVVITLKYS